MRVRPKRYWPPRIKKVSSDTPATPHPSRIPELITAITLTGSLAINVIQYLDAKSTSKTKDKMEKYILSLQTQLSSKEIEESTLRSDLLTFENQQKRYEQKAVLTTRYPILDGEDIYYMLYGKEGAIRTHTKAYRLEQSEPLKDLKSYISRESKRKHNDPLDITFTSFEILTRDDWNDKGDAENEFQSHGLVCLSILNESSFTLKNLEINCKKKKFSTFKKVSPLWSIDDKDWEFFKLRLEEIKPNGFVYFPLAHIKSIDTFHGTVLIPHTLTFLNSLTGETESKNIRRIPNSDQFVIEVEQGKRSVFMQ